MLSASSPGKSPLLWARPALLLFPFVLLGGCNHFRPAQKTETVYVLRQSFLRDRVAAVSNRVGEVHNGDRVELLDRERRFLKVKTAKGEVGWIEEHAVVNPEVVSGFDVLSKAHEKDPVVATAALRDDGYLHLKPGRDTDRYYLLAEGAKLQLLLRASVPKAVGPQASGSASSFASTPTAASGKKASAKANAARAKVEKDKADAKAAPAVQFSPKPPPPPPESLSSPEGDGGDAPATPAAPAAPAPMEDWWLVRDGQGRVGWMMSRRLDVDVPDEVAQYAEGNRMVAAYLLRKVNDPESNFADKQAPEYVTVLNPYQDGLPYDFSQVRVFTWNVKKHRYETAFRLRNLQGYLPVVVTPLTTETGAAPTFQIKQGTGESVTIDPDTGAAKPTSTEVSTYVLEGDHVSKAGAAPVAAAHSTAASAKPERRTERRKVRKSLKRGSRLQRGLSR